MNELALFAGAGGGILGGKLDGWRTVCAVEWEPYAQAVLLARQADKILEHFPIWDDVRTFNGFEWRGKVDVVTGGFPCQPFSQAGKRRGDGDSRNMWPDTIRILREIRPRYALLENVPGLLNWDGGRYFRQILGDLSESGFDARWKVISAAQLGAPHKRDRLWIVANAKCNGLTSDKVGRRTQETIHEKQEGAGKSLNITGNNSLPKTKGDVGNSNPTRLQKAWAELETTRIEQSSILADTECNTEGTTFGQGIRGTSNQEPQNGNEFRDDSGNGSNEMADSIGAGLEGREETIRSEREWRGNSRHDREAISSERRNEWWTVEPELGRVANGVANRVDRLKAIGNGQVSAVASKAWEILSEF